MPGELSLEQEGGLHNAQGVITLEVRVVPQAEGLLEQHRFGRVMGLMRRHRVPAGEF